ncbi:MAG: ketoacyl-ACP synthase III, partial [Myxococcota bacterium]
MSRRATITGTGLHAPERVVPNAFFDERYGRDISTFLREKRNIHERRWMAPDEATSDLIVPAARRAMDQAGVTIDDIDLLVVSTDTPDFLSPSTASVVAHKLGARRTGTFDINTACAGFVTALDLAAKYIAADEQYRTILVVGAYAMSKWLDLDDYKIATLFADGAGAAVVRATTSGRGFGASHLWTEPLYHDHMGIYGGGSSKPVSADVLARREHLLAFPKRIPPETNGLHWPRLARAVLERVGREPADVKHWFLTQFNLQSIHETLDALGVPRARAHLVMDRYGYTGSASIGMCLADAVAQGKLHLLAPS